MKIEEFFCRCLGFIATVICRDQRNYSEIYLEEAFLQGVVQISGSIFSLNPFLQKHLPFLLTLLKNLWNLQEDEYYHYMYLVFCVVTTGVCRHSYVSCVKGGKCYLNKVAKLTKVYSVEIVIWIVGCKKQFSWQHLFPGCVFLLYWNMRSLWRQRKKKRNISECNLNKQNQQNPFLCTGEILWWPFVPCSTFQINWELNLLEMYQFSWLVWRNKKIPPLSGIWQG